MPAAFQLGRVSAPIPANVPVLDAHPIMQATAPERLPRGHVPFQPTLGGNDQLGDCTAVALANAIHAQAALGGWDVAIADQPIIDLYGAASGYDPAVPGSDRGCVEVRLLSWQARYGFPAGKQTPFVGLWANVPADDLNLLGLVAARFGGIYLGVNLAEADQAAPGTGRVWDIDTPASDGDPRPGSWGAHALFAWSYDGLEDTSIWQLATWGFLQPCTTRWLRSRLEEAHLVYHRQLLGAAGRNWVGLDADRLAADVAAFGVAP